jgi:ketosteroid isomerase-like protein
MKKPSHKTLALILVCLTYIGCKDYPNENTSTKTSDAELESIIKKQVDSLYRVYERFDYDWMEFFADEYTAIYPDNPIQHMKKDSLKAQWEQIYAKYNVKLLDRGTPNVIISEDMAISYNTFNEIFINKETSDTIKNVGTYIVNWKKQPDNSWKIVFETLQNHK